MIFPINKSKYNILQEIYNNPGIKISDLCKKAKVSSSVCYFHLKDLKESEIVEEKLVGKKPQIKQLFPNLKSENGKLIFSLIENEKRIKFFKKYRNLKGCFLHLVSNLPTCVSTLVVFGSYARFVATEKSDLDILFIIHSKKNLTSLENLIEEAFVTFSGGVSPKIIEEHKFIKNRKDPLIASIINEHVCIFNTIKFLDLISKF